MLAHINIKKKKKKNYNYCSYNTNWTNQKNTIATVDLRIRVFIYRNKYKPISTSPFPKIGHKEITSFNFRNPSNARRRRKGKQEKRGLRIRWIGYGFV